MPSKHPTEQSPEWSCGCGKNGTGKESFNLHKATCLLYLRYVADAYNSVAVNEIEVQGN